MYMKFFVSLLLLLSSSSIVAQDLECSDFREGVFTIYTDTPIASEGTLIRKGNKQIESYYKIPDEFRKQGFPTEPVTVRMEWIEACSYLLFSGADPDEFNQADNYIEEKGGILNEMVKIEGNCFFYRSSLEVDGEELVITGRICKKS